MELFDAISTRASAARLAEPGPTPEHLLRILEAATHAPDHGRLKPWRLIVLHQAARHQFADAVVAARRSRLPEPTEEQLELEREKLWRSPTLVVVGCALVRDNPKVPEVEQVLSVGAAAQNMFLAAHALGYGVMWKTGPAAYDDRVKRSVGLQAHDHIVAIMHFGTRTK
jgi:nitroreductase